MMGDPGIVRWSNWKNYLWKFMILAFYLIYGRILQCQNQKEVKWTIPIWDGTHRLCKECICCFAGSAITYQTKVHINMIYCGIWSLIWCSGLSTFLMAMKGRILEEDTLHSTAWSLIFKGSTVEVCKHHFHLMQSNHIFLFISIFCLSFITTKMENFNVNINGSPNGSSTGSSEISHEALLELCLVGTVITDKPIRFQFMEERLSSIWRPGQGVTITQAGENKFHFQFYHEWDLERVLQNGPWTFDGFLLVLKKLEIGEAISEVVFNEAEVWVQVFNLPHGYMNEYVGMLIGCHIGRFVQYDESNYYGPWRMYMRMRVALNIAEPLKRSMVFEKEDGTAVHVSFKYERLGVFCYICGIMGHTDGFCPRRLEPGFTDEARGWGRFLNAGGRNVGGNVTVNKWLRGGRVAARGGRNGGRGTSDGNNGINDPQEHPNNVVVMAQSSEHALFGRVRVLRGGGFTFHRMVTNIIGHNGGGEGQWVPFELTATNIANQITIMQLVNGMGALNPRSNNSNNPGVTVNDGGIIAESQQGVAVLAENNLQQIQDFDGSQVLTGCNQVTGQILSICWAGTANNRMGETSEVGRLVYARKKDKTLPIRPIMQGPLVIRERADNVIADNTKDLPSNDKGKGKMEEGPATKMKKRTRPNVVQDVSNNAGGTTEQVSVRMNIDAGNEGAGAGSSSISVHNNPLFSENVVMAEAENQPRQEP